MDTLDYPHHHVWIMQLMGHVAVLFLLCHLIVAGKRDIKAGNRNTRKVTVTTLSVKSEKSKTLLIIEKVMNSVYAMILHCKATLGRDQPGLIR